MNWYKKAQIDNENANVENTPSPHVPTTRFKDRISPTLKGLMSEALKYPTFEEFEQAYIGQIKHGRYWHVTYNPNFTIDPELGPRDMSSMSGTSKMTKGQLMITSDLPHWAAGYQQANPPRMYAAEIDMSNVPTKSFFQVNRGFGNEFMVTDPSMAKVVRVVPLKNALQIDKKYDKTKPQSQSELRDLYFMAQQRKNELV